MQDFLQVYGKTGEPCPRCATPIEKIKVGGRGHIFVLLVKNDDKNYWNNRWNCFWKINSG